MDINKMLADLRTERDQIAEAIVVLEHLTVGRGKRRGRPPKWMTEVKRRGRPPKNPLAAAVAATVKTGPKKRSRLSPAKRKAQSERMKAYWAKRKKQAAKD